MYTIKCDDYILSDNRIEELFVANPTLNLEVNKNGSAEFTIYPSHPYYNQLNKLKSIISIIQDNKIIFKGRIIDDEKGFYNEKKISVEGVMAFLNDSIQEPFNYNDTVAHFFTNIINNHNSQVDDFQKFKIGNITVNASLNFISTEYSLTKDILQKNLLDNFGGYLNIRYEDDGNYIDYLSDFEHIATQTIEYSKNLITLTEKIDATDIKTGILPLGAKLKDSEGKETNNRLTIESVNNGNKYLFDNEMVNQYGKISQIMTYDDITNANDLLSQAKKDLSESIKLSNTIELTAIDLNVVDKSMESFHFCDYIRIYSKPHNIDKTFLLQKINIDLSNPQNTKITLGATVKTLTDINNETNKSNYSLEERVNVIYNDYTTTENVEEIVDQKSSINIVTDAQASLTNRIIDDKQEFVKKINFGNLPSSGEKSIDLNLNVSTCEITQINTIIKDDDNNYFPFPHLLNENLDIQIDGTNNALIVNVGNTDMSKYSMIIDVFFINN